MIWKLLAGKNNGVLGINRRNIDYVYRGNARKYFRLVDMKLLTKEILGRAGLPVPETYTSFTNFSELKNLDERIGKFENFVIKPNKGRGGMGIMICAEKVPGGYAGISGKTIPMEKIKKRIADIIFGSFSFGMNDIAIIEKRLFPHRFFRDIYDGGLPDIRIITYYNRPVMAMLRIPTSLSGGRANLHQGGIGAGIDLETGETVHAVFRGESATIHPDSGRSLIGLKIPFFSEMIDMCAKFPPEIPLNYVGFDFAVDEERGPVILEVNARPGLAIQVANNSGLLKILSGMEKR